MTDRREALAAMFGAKGAKVDTNRGESYYNNLLKVMNDRLTQMMIKSEQI